MFTSSPSMEKLPATTKTLLALMFAAVAPAIALLFAALKQGHITCMQYNAHDKVEMIRIA